MGAAASSSSSSSSSSSKKYDVFISFRGEDTRTNFTSHLHTALCQKSIRTYIDYELPRGDEIKHSLMRAIEDSSISIVVLSENYANSKWCLNELVKIIECKRDQGQVVIPVFYNVDPSHVRHQQGTFKEAFATHETDSRLHQHILNNWNHALFETANLAGWDSKAFRDESELIQKIVNNVLQQMRLSGYPTALNGLVGTNENCDCIESLLKRSPKVGIWGMGGIGKTTMARVVFAKLSSQFEGCCFLENVREESERYGLRYLREKLLLELLKEDNLYGSTHHQLVESFAFSMRRISRKKVFIVLDDVTSWQQLEYLARDCNGLGQGSKVIITTRDKHLLVGNVDEIYEAKALTYRKSLQLFHLKAFHKDYPKIGYEELAERAVDYSKGIPLALIVLGSFLHSKTTKEWDDALTKLKKSPNQNIQKVFQLSFDGLNNEEKEIFLDISCFFKGEKEVNVIRLLEINGFHASIGLRTLLDNALISIIDGIVWMHELIREMGCEVVLQECMKEPEKRSRLYDPEEICSVLENNTGTSAIEGLMLDLSKIKDDISLSAHTFQKMTKLRFLKFYFPYYKGSCKLKLPLGLESLPNTLRYLQLDGYPLESLPSTFCPKKIVELCMQGSHLKKLWDGVQDFGNLRRINLSESTQLIELPDFSKAQNLEEVDLTLCVNLCYVHSSVLSLQKLGTLILYGCEKLKELKSETHLKSLSHLDVSNCCSLQEFSLSSEKIKKLYLYTSGIKILDSSIMRLGKLTVFVLNGSRLKYLPINELCCLGSLEVLSLFECNQVIDKLQLRILFEALRSLRELRLHMCCNITELPDNIKNLSKLVHLSLNSLKRLRSLPELPPSIASLYVTNCTSLEFCLLSVPEKRRMLDLVSHSSIEYLKKLTRLSLHASNLKNFSIDQLCCFRSLRVLILFDCGQVIAKSKLSMLFDVVHTIEELCLEGCSNLYELPDNISALSSLRSLRLKGSNLKRLPDSLQHFPWLVSIKLINCRRFKSIPQLPLFNGYVKATNHKSQEAALLSTSIPTRKCALQSFILQNCLRLNERSLSCIEDYAYFSLKQGVYMNHTFDTVGYPGNRVPKWFRYNQTKEASSSIAIELYAPFNNLLGFVFCSVISQFSLKQGFQSSLQCKFHFEDVEQMEGITIEEHYSSDHVFLWSCPDRSMRDLQRLLRRKCDEGNTDNPTFSFKFSVIERGQNNKEIKRHGLIQACGVCPVYASEYGNFLQQMEMEKSLKFSRSRAIDDHSICGVTEYAKFTLKPFTCGNLNRSILSHPEMIPEWFTYKSSTTRTSIFVDLPPDLDCLLGFFSAFSSLNSPQ